MVGQKSMHYLRNNWAKLIIWKELLKSWPKHTTYTIGSYHTVEYAMSGPERPRTIVSKRLDWPRTAMKYLCWAPWSVQDDLRLQLLIASWFVCNDNKLLTSSLFRNFRNDTELLSNRWSVHVRNDTKLLSSELFMSEMTVKFHPAGPSLHVRNGIILKHQWGRRDFGRKYTQDAWSVDQKDAQQKNSTSL